MSATAHRTSPAIDLALTEIVVARVNAERDVIRATRAHREAETTRNGVAIENTRRRLQTAARKLLDARAAIGAAFTLEAENRA